MDGHHDVSYASLLVVIVVMSIVTSTPVATRDHSSHGQMMSRCPSLLDTIVETGN
jgi:hypothetical protein